MNVDQTSIAVDPAQRREGLLSVVVCNFNYGRFLEAALQSVVAQSVACELIVVDDGSTDDSREILQRWSSRATVVLQENGGQVSAYNSGFAHVHGEFVIFLDSDDLLDATTVKRALAVFQPEVAKVHWYLGLIDEEGAALGVTIPYRLGSGDVGSKLRTHGLLYSSSPGSGNAYRTSVLDQLFPLPLNGEDRHGADFFVIYGSSLFGSVRTLGSLGGRYRTQAEAGTAFKSLSFGNASSRSPDLGMRLDSRVARFKDWIRLRTDGRIEMPERFLEFSTEKISYARAIFMPESYRVGFSNGVKRLRPLLNALWFRRDVTRLSKLGLTAWAAIVLLLPRKLGLPIARFVCNPVVRQ